MSSDTITESEAELHARKLLREKEWFLAYDAARAALDHWPTNRNVRHYAARALIALGAPEEAEKILAPLTASSGDVPDSSDEETLGLLGRVHKAKWQESLSLEDARRCRDIYHRAFQQTGGHWTCVNVITMSWILGRMLERNGDAAGANAEYKIAREMAQQALQASEEELAQAAGTDRFWALASRGEAWLHLDKPDEAIRTFEEAAAIAQEDHSLIVPPARQMRLLQEHGFPVPPRVLEILKPPTVIAYSGHMIDAPDRAMPRFTSNMEPQVRARIDAALEKLDARIGFGSAACGADLIFIEALLDRGAEVHIVLPFAKEDFIRESVLPGGPEWEERFHRAIARVGNAVTYATREPFLDTVRLFSFADQLVRALAWQHAGSMATEPTLVAVYDGSPNTTEGGTADNVLGWPEAQRVIIGLPPVPPHPAQPAGNSAPMPATAETPIPRGMTRSIKTLLFADVVNFSKLSEDRIPFFMYSFLQKAAELLNKAGPVKRAVETWGDGIFVVMDEALPLLRYATALRDIDFEKLNLPKEMSVRIGLHAGPVFEGMNAMTQRTTYYGSHVNRAARIEPITLPGHIYASQTFIALLDDEQRRQSRGPLPFVSEYVGTAAALTEQQLRAGPEAMQEFVSEYLGNLALAKNFGDMPVYRVREKRRSVS